VIEIKKDRAEDKQTLEVVVKCDTKGSEEAVVASIAALDAPHASVRVIHSGIGAVTKSDLLMAQSGSRLVLGFNVDVLPKIDQLSQEQNIEIRLYEVIYRLLNDLREILRSYTPEHPMENVLGAGRVIALFKSGRRDSIVGCDIVDGVFSLERSFRIISAMGPIYTGRIESMQIESTPVTAAKKGQKVGIKINDFRKAREGDLVECFEVSGPGRKGPWQPRGGVIKH
jgi:translation initiation factor IF-2